MIIPADIFNDKCIGICFVCVKKIAMHYQKFESVCNKAMFDYILRQNVILATRTHVSFVNEIRIDVDIE